MAEHFVLRNMQFLYCDEYACGNLFQELCSRFAYQKVLILEDDGYLEKYFAEKKRETRFFATFQNKIDDGLYDCIVCTNENMIDYVKEYCVKNDCFCVLFVKDYIPIKSIYSLLDNSKKGFLLGVVIDSDYVEQSQNCFAVNFVLDMIAKVFSCLEADMNHVYFNEKNNVFSSSNVFFAKKIEKTLQSFKENDQDYRILLDFYSSLIMDNSGYKTILDTKELQLVTRDVSKKLYYQSIISEILMSIYSTFISNINRNIKEVMACGDKSKSVDVNLNYINFYDKFDNERFWFVNSRFGNTMISKIDEYLQIVEFLKNCLYEIDVEKIYSFNKQVEFFNIKKNLKTASLCYEGDSFLKIINNFGYLDFK